MSEVKPHAGWEILFLFCPMICVSEVSQPCRSHKSVSSSFFITNTFPRGAKLRPLFERTETLPDDILF